MEGRHEATDFIVALAPIILIVGLTLKPNAPPQTTTLPLAGLLSWILRLVYFQSEPNRINAECIASALSASNAITIVFGAVVLFKTMELTGCLQWIVKIMKSVTQSHPVAEAMLIAHAFVYITEGASGFGTPVALAAPILIELGHEPRNAIASALIVNAVCTNFGAVGTPIWFGFSSLGLDEESLHGIGLRCAILQAISAFIIVPCAVSLLAGIRATRSSICFIIYSIFVVSCPSLLIAWWSYEFASLLAGLIGFPLTLVLIKYRIGLAPHMSDVQRNRATIGSEMQASDSFQKSQQSTPLTSQAEVASTRDINVEPRSATVRSAAVRQVSESGSFAVALAASPSSPNIEGLSTDACAVATYTFPITASVILLVLTRVEAFGIKELLRLLEPSLTFKLGTFGDAHLSVSGVLSLEEIFNTNAKWKLELLYTPFIIPFIIIALATMAVHRKKVQILHGQSLCPRSWQMPFTVAAQRVRGPTIALTGAMILVGMLTVNTRPGEATSDAPAAILGSILARWLGNCYVLVVAPIGALGSFFSGSTTVSNLTFGAIQETVAHDIGASVPAVLALQCAAAASGNMICLSNIIAVKSVVGLPLPESELIRATLPFCAAHCIIVTVVAAVFFLYA